jgi:drug/metabolite transporter (DMT)-like permease
MALVLTLFALFASIFVIAKEALETVRPFFLVGSRMLLAAIILFAYLLWKDKKLVFPKEHAWKLCLLGLTGIYLTNALEFWGLQFLSPAKTCFIYSLSPFIAALFSFVFLGERMTGRKWTGLGVGILGFGPILLSADGMEPDSDLALFFLSWAELSVVGATVSSVLGWILMRNLVSTHGVSPLVVNAWSMLFGGIMALVNSGLIGEWDPLPYDDMPRLIEVTLLMVVISSLICYNLYGYLLQSYTATFMSFAGFTTPFFTAIFEYLWFGQIVSWSFILSTAFVFMGLFLFYQEELKNEGIALNPSTLE